MTTTEYPVMEAKIGRFTIEIERSDHSSNPDRVLWRAKCCGGLCFGGFIERGTPDDTFRRLVVVSVVDQASRMADFANECVKIWQHGAD
jgi:hypothetical protein